jgi:hypothetical protein
MMDKHAVSLILTPRKPLTKTVYLYNFQINYLRFNTPKRLWCNILQIKDLCCEAHHTKNICKLSGSNIMHNSKSGLFRKCSERLKGRDLRLVARKQHAINRKLLYDHRHYHCRLCCHAVVLDVKSTNFNCFLPTMKFPQRLNERLTTVDTNRSSIWTSCQWMPPISMLFTHFFTKCIKWKHNTEVMPVSSHVSSLKPFDRVW